MADGFVGWTAADLLPLRLTNRPRSGWLPLLHCNAVDGERADIYWSHAEMEHLSFDDDPTDRLIAQRLAAPLHRLTYARIFSGCLCAQCVRLTSLPLAGYVHTIHGIKIFVRRQLCHWRWCRPCCAAMVRLRYACDACNVPNVMLFCGSAVNQQTTGSAQ